MVKAVEKAAIGITRDFGEIERLQSSQKGLDRFGESSYNRSEDQIKYVLSKAYPDIEFFDKKSDLTSSDKPIWVVTPINGYDNFLRGLPSFSISVALLESTEVVSSVILAPLRGECYKTEIGSGAFVNNRNRLRVSGRRFLEQSVVAVNLACHAVPNSLSEQASIRKTDSVLLDLAYCSSGKIDACVMDNVPYEQFIAGLILVRESGGFIEYKMQNGGNYNIVSASSLELMKKLLSLYNTV